MLLNPGAHVPANVKSVIGPHINGHISTVFIDVSCLCENEPIHRPGLRGRGEGRAGVKFSSWYYDNYCGGSYS